MSELFSHLRVSSEYSISQGLLTVDQIVENAVQSSVPSVALTDKSNMFGLVKFFNKCESAGIKPISGASIRLLLEEDEHSYELLCLAKTNIGHKNLMKILSSAHNNNHYKTPMIEFKDLITLKNDIVVISGGKESHIFEYLRKDNIEKANNFIEILRKNFDEDFVIEVQRTNRVDEINYFNKVLPLSVEKGIPIVATNDVLFSNKDDFETHEAKVCINTGKTLNDPHREKIFSEQQYFKSPKEMADLFNDCISLIDNTNEISKKCNVSIKTKGYFLPEYPVPKKHDFDSYLAELSNTRLNTFIKDFKPGKQRDYKSRLDYELDQIKTMGFSSYFLIVHDFIEWSKINDVPVGPGRGSGAGSLVAFSLGITSLDPIKHGLLFERFLNPERLSMPDFDIDFCMEKRDLVIDYVSNKYGSEAVSQIVTFGTMAARMVIRDVTRALGKPHALGDRIAKMIPFDPGMTLEKAKKEQPIFADSIKKDEEVKEIVSLSHKLEGIARNVGKHAGGVVIAPGSISDFCPVYVDRQSKSIMTQYDKDDVEKIGLVKFDFLGLRTLTVIDRAVKSINESKKTNKLDINSISLDDEKVFNLLSSGKTMAIFQLESSGMKDLIKKLKPSRFEEITALLALYRPGPLNSGMHEEFVNRKHGENKVTYPHDLLKPVLEETYGIIVYQEQVMEAARVLADFSLGQADILRRAMGKKKIEEMEEQREVFIAGCKKNNIDAKQADRVFDLINEFAEYGFNKSHSAAYALISYQTAFLKTYYPEHFMAAVLSTELDNTDKIHALINECSRMGIKILKPNILTSNKYFKVNEDLEIEYGLGAIKGVADNFIDHVCSERENFNFKDIWDFSKKIDTKIGGKRSLEALCQSGAFDKLAPSRSIALASIEDILKVNSSNKSNSNLKSINLLETIQDDIDPFEVYRDIQQLTESQKLKLEKQSLGYYLSGHPVLALENKVRIIRSKRIKELNNDIKKATLVCLINSIRQTKDRKGKPLTFINFDDGTGIMEGIISSEIWETYHHILKKDEILVLKGIVEIDDYKTNELGSLMYRMIVKEAHSIDSELSEKVSEVLIDLEKSDVLSIEDFSMKLEAIDHNFWKDGSCNLNIKVLTDESEFVIDIGDQFKFKPSLENFFYLEEIFGKDVIDF